MSKDFDSHLNPAESLNDRRKTTKGLSATTIRRYASLTTNVIINTIRERQNNNTHTPQTANWKTSLKTLSTHDTPLYSVLSSSRAFWIRKTEKPSHISGPLRSSDFGHIISKSIWSSTPVPEEASLSTFLQFFRKLFSQRSQTITFPLNPANKLFWLITFNVVWRFWLWATTCWGNEATVAVKIVERSTRIITINQLIWIRTPPIKDCLIIFWGTISLDGERI